MWFLGDRPLVSAPTGPVRLKCRYDMELIDFNEDTQQYEACVMYVKPNMQLSWRGAGNTALYTFCHRTCGHTFARTTCDRSGHSTTALFDEDIEDQIPQHAQRTTLPLEAMAAHNFGVGLTPQAWRKHNHATWPRPHLLRNSPTRLWTETELSQQALMFTPLPSASVDPIPRTPPTPPGYVMVLDAAGGPDSAPGPRLIPSENVPTARAISTRLDAAEHQPGDPTIQGVDLFWERDKAESTRMLMVLTHKAVAAKPILGTGLGLGGAGADAGGGAGGYDDARFPMGDGKRGHGTRGGSGGGGGGSSGMGPD